jgi:hypothetical protein
MVPIVWKMCWRFWRVLIVVHVHPATCCLVITNFDDHFFVDMIMPRLTKRSLESVGELAKFFRLVEIRCNRSFPVPSGHRH